MNNEKDKLKLMLESMLGIREDSEKDKVVEEKKDSLEDTFDKLLPMKDKDTAFGTDKAPGKKSITLTVTFDKRASFVDYVMDEGGCDLPLVLIALGKTLSRIVMKTFLIDKEHQDDCDKTVIGAVGKLGLARLLCAVSDEDFGKLLEV